MAGLILNSDHLEERYKQSRHWQELKTAPEKNVRLLPLLKVYGREQKEALRTQMKPGRVDKPPWKDMAVGIAEAAGARKVSCSR